jgi:hypothetical protein
MRFSLRTLLLFFPALIIAYGVAWLVAVGIVDQPRLPKPAGWSSYDYNLLYDYMERGVQLVGGGPFDWRKLNDYFAGKLPASDPDYSWHSLRHPRTTDIHGNHYFCIPLNAEYSPDPALTKPRCFGFYSVGQDGLSASYGEDSDDTNSWHFEKPSFWRAWDLEKSWHYRRVALWLTPLTFFAVYRLWKRLTRRRIARRKLPKQIDYPVSEGPTRSLVPEFLKD